MSIAINKCQSVQNDSRGAYKKINSNIKNLAMYLFQIKKLSKRGSEGKKLNGLIMIFISFMLG